MSPRVLEPSREDLEARHTRLLERLGVNRAELERLAETGALSGEQIWLWEDIRSIEFLLGDDVDH
jgi:hypothetical protein